MHFHNPNEGHQLHSNPNAQKLFKKKYWHPYHKHLLRSR
ncbi:protein of unknown function [Streptococcus thermophilus]|nr:protein of unknown function [Streptococcus thermophilus]CAD0149409.1 protein of unknown function [Streptococcus thermophilus]